MKPQMRLSNLTPTGNVFVDGALALLSPLACSTSVHPQSMPTTQLRLDACASYFYRGCLFLCVVDGSLGHLTGHMLPDKSRRLTFGRRKLHGGPMPLSLHDNGAAMEQS
jgi:hypothetical protein